MNGDFMKNVLIGLLAMSSLSALASCPDVKAKKVMGTPWSYSFGAEKRIDLGNGRTQIVRPRVGGDFKGTTYTGYERQPEDNYALVGKGYTGNKICECLGYDAYEFGSKRIEDPGYVRVIRPVKSLVLNGAESISELVCIKN